jgi:signal transduction histidine kinase/CheY-like chemotaxis protein
MLIGTYVTPLVIVSVLVAIFASYTALSLAGRVAHSNGVATRWWIAGGGVAMGTGIWAMHFIGMLAFRLPIRLGYDLWITLLSLLLPIMVSGLALWRVSQSELPIKHLVSGALLMGVGISTMHYTGMAAMQMDPGIFYAPSLFIASVFIAIVASGGALWLAFRLRLNTRNVLLARAGGACVMGIAIAGMHYTGMAAAHFPLDSICRAASDGVSQDSLAILIIVGAMAVLTIALLTSIFDARLEARSRILAISQATAVERQELLMREQKARTQAERMNELKDEFLATLSHELRTPLNAILGWAQLLHLKANDAAFLQKGLDTIERNAHAQAKLIEDLLDMNRILSGKLRMDTKRVDSTSFIKDALDSIRPAAIAKHIQIETVFAPTIQPITGDPNRLQQVIWNLLSNAIKFTPNGGMVKISLERQIHDIVIEVTDSGIGIDPEFLPYVFDRFRQADASTTRKYGGLGLGLAIVKSLVELHGGTISVASQGKNKGASFTVCLPIHHNADDIPTSILPHLNAFTTITPNFKPIDLTGAKIVVIDDDADALDLIETILNDCGVKIFTATNAMQGFSLVQSERPDAIISDIGMPDIDGLSFIRSIRKLEPAEGSGTPAIAFTAFSRSEDRSRALEAGFTRYMSKPVDANELVATLASLIKPSVAQ